MEKEYTQQALYISPSVEVVELKARQLICLSNDNGSYPGLSNDDTPYGF